MLTGVTLLVLGDAQDRVLIAMGGRACSDSKPNMVEGLTGVGYVAI